MKINCIALSMIMAGHLLIAQDLMVVNEPGVYPPQQRREIIMPTLEGYEIIKGDFHMHTVFSDGAVWPVTRVREAWRDGLDAIAISDHVEFRPKKEHVPGSLNLVHEIALPEAQNLGMILIKAAEITRAMPPGHLNAMFLTDIDKLDTESWQDALQEARDQGAFIFWNHPCWKAQQPDTCIWFEEHEMLFRQGLIHGIEVFNSSNWYPVALDWTRDKNLAFLASSDLHGPAPYMPGYSDYFRPMTLVIAREKTEASLKEALFNRNSVAFFAGNLAGPATGFTKFSKHRYRLVAPIISCPMGRREFD